MGARNVSNYVHKDDFSYLTAIWQVLWTGEKKVKGYLRPFWGTFFISCFRHLFDALTQSHLGVKAMVE